MIDDVKSRLLVPAPEITKSNLKSLPSAGKISRPVAPENTKRQDASVVSHIVRDLNDAVSYSSLALRSLERVGSEATAAEGEARIVEEFLPGLEQLRSDIGQALETLRKRAEEVEIARENITSADSRIQDVELAQTHAEQTGVQIHRQIDQAMEAHNRLSPTKVSQLLS